MFVLTFTVFNSYSKPESKPIPLSKPSTSKLDTTVLPEPGSDFVSAEAKFFQRKPVEMEIDVQESNLKPSEIARYKKFGPKKPEDETDFRQQGFVVSESQFIQGPYDIQVDQKTVSGVQFVQQTVSQMSAQRFTETERRVFQDQQSGRAEVEQPAKPQPLEVDLGVYGLEPSELTKKTSTQVSKQFQTKITDERPQSQQPSFISTQFQPGQPAPVDVDLGVDQSGLEPAGVTRTTYSQVSKKFQTEVAGKVSPSEKPGYRSVEFKPMVQKPIDVSPEKPQQMTVSKITTKNVSKKFETGISEKVPAAQQPDFVSAEAKFFQRGPGSLDVEIEEEANLKPSEIAQLKKQKTLAKRYPPTVPPKPKVTKPEDGGKPHAKVEFYKAVSSPTHAQTFQETFKFLEKPPGFSSVKPPTSIQKTPPVEKTVYFPDDKLSVTSLTLKTTSKAPAPPPPKPKKPTQPKKSEVTLQMKPLKPEISKPKLSPKMKRVEHKKKEQRVTFSSDEGPKIKHRPQSDEGPKIKYRSESDSIFTESDSEAPSWAYVGPKIRKKKPSEAPKRLVIDIEPLKLQSELVDSWEPIRAPEPPKPQIVDTDSEDVTHWAPDHSIIPKVASDIEKREEELRLARVGCFGVFISAQKAFGSLCSSWPFMFLISC